MRNTIGVVLILLAVLCSGIVLIRILVTPTPVFDGLSMLTLVLLAAGVCILLAPTSER